MAVFENDTDYTDGDGRPPHCVEVLLFDGDPAAIPDNDIAQTIADVIAGGVATYGNTTGTAQVVNGDATAPKTVNFSRAVSKDVYLEFDIEQGDGYPGDAALKEYIASEANKKHRPDVDVAWSLLVALAFGLGGVAKCTQLRLGFSSSPSAHETDLTIDLREIARFSTDNIVITSS